MPGTVLHTGTTAACPHGGTLSIVAASPRVSVSRVRVAVLTDHGLVVGCGFMLPNGKPQPCITARWITAATRVFVNGQPVLINPLLAVCLSAEQIPGGPPIITASQTRVIAT